MFTIPTRIVHLSDLHFGKYHAFTDDTGIPPSATGNSLIELVVDDIRAIGAPDLVIISGDLTSTGMKSEFGEATTFLEETARTLSLEKNQFLVIPGNHDVVWAADGETASQGEYQSFVSRFFNLPVSELEIPTLSHNDVFVLGLDSTRLLSPRLGGLGLLGKDQLQDALKKLSEEGADARHKILVTHHHLLPVAWIDPALPEELKSLTIDAPFVIAWAQEHEFSMILHGHQHQPYLSTFHFADRKGGPLVISGCASVGAQNLPPQGRNGYQWIEIDGRSVVVHRRELDEAHSFRAVDGIRFAQDETGMFAETAIPSARSHRDPSVQEIRSLMRSICAQTIDSISVCFGPRGGLAATSKVGGTAQVRDGYSIVHTQAVSDPVHRRIFELMESTVRSLGEHAGDGRKSTVLICCRTLEVALRYVDDGYSDRDIALEIEKAALESTLSLEEITDVSTTVDKLKCVAITAAGGASDIGEKITEALTRDGKDVYVSLDAAIAENHVRRLSIEEDNWFGVMNAPIWLKPLFAIESGELHLEQPFVLVYPARIATMSMILPLLERAVTEAKPIIFCCHGIEGEAMAVIAENCSKGVVRAIPFQLGARQESFFEDVALLTGAEFLSHDMGRLPNPQDLGFAEKVVATKNTVQIFPDLNRVSQDLECAIRRLQLEVETVPLANRDYLRKRIARLSSANRQVTVHGSSEEDATLYLSLMKDSLKSSQEAMRSGFVPGGGCSYAKVAELLDLRAKDSPGKQAFREGLLLPSSIIKASLSKVDSDHPPDALIHVEALDAAGVVKQSIMAAGDLASRLIRTRSVQISSTKDEP